jgi:dehydrogenase/reductase SDR family protein 12
MIKLHERIVVPRSAQAVLDYVADFSKVPEWDSTAIEAHQTNEGPVGLGSEFSVRCALPLGSVGVHYRIEAFEPERTVVLVGTSRWFDNVDSIELTSTPEGTQIDYRAEFRWRGPLARFEAAMQSGMQRMGQRSVEGLRRALSEVPPRPTARASTRRADRWILPGLLRFSRWGYLRSRRHWQPMSARLEGKRVVITGASSGLGLAAAAALGRLGAELTLVIRDPAKEPAMRAQLEKAGVCGGLQVELADLSLMRDVDALSRRLLDRGARIDVLINNAGALFNPRQLTPEGLEQSFALLLLSPYRLSRALQPLLGQGSRVVNVVSGGMYTARLRIADLQATAAAYSGAKAYAHCKRALMVLTEQWAQQWSERGIVVNAMHPGWADTPGIVSALPGFHRLTRRILRSPDEGADTMVWLAAAPEAGLISGQLFLDREPHTTHLLASTQESTGAREALQAALDAAWPSGS